MSTPLVTIEIHPWGCVTRFSDGTSVPAAPEDTDSYRATAQRLGYDSDVLAMCIAHEMCHTLLAVQRGGAVSPTLHAVALGVSYDGAGREEDDVMVMQEMLAGV